MTRRRVVVTGLGVVSAIGNDRASFWESLVAGRHGFREMIASLLAYLIFLILDIKILVNNHHFVCLLVGISRYQLMKFLLLSINQ